MYASTLGHVRYAFPDLKAVLAAASPPRSGDLLAGLAAGSMEERVAARHVLADLPLARFLEEPVIPYEADEVTRLILDGHNRAEFARVSGMTVGDFREWLLSDEAEAASLSALSAGLTPEMAAAVSKLMRNQDLIAVARKCEVISAFRNTIGLEGRLSVRIQPNHPTDDPAGIAAAVLEFQLAHARARDAVYQEFDSERMAAALPGPDVRIVHSRAVDRQMYLQRPDLGRRLDDRSAAVLARGDHEAVFVITDGLSARGP